MEIRDYIINNNLKRVGMIGRAGSGKTTLCKTLGFNTYSVDSSFIKDSSFRKDLLNRKALLALDSYIDACNMYNWWDWSKVENDINSIEVFPLIVEGAILGPDSIINKLDKILFMLVDIDIRFTQLRGREENKRSLKDSLVRFLITEYSESIYYKHIIDTFSNKILFIGRDGYFLDNNVTIYNLEEFIPMRFKL